MQGGSAGAPPMAVINGLQNNLPQEKEVANNLSQRI